MFRGQLAHALQHVMPSARGTLPRLASAAGSSDVIDPAATFTPCCSPGSFVPAPTPRIVNQHRQGFCLAACKGSAR